MRIRKGQTLVEVLVATMVAAMTATAVFSVVLSASVSGGKSDRKEAGSLVINGVAEQLKGYVSAEPGNAAFSPNAGGTWSADSSGVWALRSGTHIIQTSYLTAIPELSSRNPSMSYIITNVDCLGMGAAAKTEFNQCKQVSFTLDYDD